MEKTAYCEIGPNYIRVYLYKVNAQKCSDYIQSMDASILAVYKNMITVQKLIDNGYEKAYWTQVKADMLAQIRDYQVVRSNILYRVSLFEKNFFTKVKLYMEKYLLSYQQTLELRLDKLEHSDIEKFSTGMVEEANGYVVQIHKQLDLIQDILDTKNLEELIDYIPSYLYLKKEIE
ncbi:MAG: hypothetical protein GXP45_05040 [bacterium]|nr:hypothetical protein [bacterium]